MTDSYHCNPSLPTLALFEVHTSVECKPFGFSVFASWEVVPLESCPWTRMVSLICDDPLEQRSTGHHKRVSIASPPCSSTYKRTGIRCDNGDT
ncbi:hypothetical protein ACOMHN_043099 [Nucella lapillus]